MKEKIKKEHLRRTRKFLEAKFCSRNVHQKNKPLCSPPYKILGTILNMNKGVTQTNQLKDKVIDKMHNAFHPRNDIDRLYVSSKRGRGLSSIEDHVDALNTRRIRRID